MKFSCGTSDKQFRGDSRSPFMKPIAASSVCSSAFISKLCSYLKERQIMAHSLFQWRVALKKVQKQPRKRPFRSTLPRPF